MDDLFDFMKKITREKAEAIKEGAYLAKELQDAHLDHLEYITICVYCGSQTLAPCCGENHHEQVPVDKDGNLIDVPKTPSTPSER